MVHLQIVLLKCKSCAQSSTSTVYSDKMTMELSFFCFQMGCRSEFLQNDVFLSLERDCFYLKVSKQCRP